MKLVHEENSVVLIQSKYIQEHVRTLGHNTFKPALVSCDISIDLSTSSPETAEDNFPYESVIGSLVYIATNTRPEIAVATGMLAQHVETPSMKHQIAVIKIIKYLKGVADMGLNLKSNDENQLDGYVDASRAGEPGSGRRSRSEICLFYLKACIKYPSTLQECSILSITEA